MSASGFMLIRNDQPKKHQSEQGQEASCVLRTYYFKESKVGAALNKITSNKSAEGMLV